MAPTGSLKRSRSEVSISFDAAPVKVIVGSEKKVFYVHNSALTSTSEFFKSALKEEWRKNKDGDISLPDYSEDISNTYVRWLYSGNSLANGLVAVTYELVSQNYILFAKLYALGEQLNDSNFQDDVINAIVAQVQETNENGKRWYPTGDEVSIIYENTSAGSPARRLMVDLHVRSGRPQWIEDDKMNHEFLIDLSRALLAERKLPANSETKYDDALQSGGLCKYHNHDRDKPCY